MELVSFYKNTILFSRVGAFLCQNGLIHWNTRLTNSLLHLYLISILETEMFFCSQLTVGASKRTLLTTSFNSDVRMFWRQRRNMMVRYITAISHRLVDPRCWHHLLYGFYCLVKPSSGSWTHNTLMWCIFTWFLQTGTLLCFNSMFSQYLVLT